MSNRLPSVTSDIPRDLRTFIDRLREIVTGTGNDRLISAQDLIDGGLASAGNNGTLTVPATTGVIGTPPAPTNLSVTPAVDANFIEWDDPVYFGHDYTEVFSGATNVIGDAVLLGFTPGVNYVDTLGSQQSRYYWARFVNRLGVKGPFNSVTGTLGTTLPEVDHLLNVLTGEITETQLFTDLGSRIDLVDTTNGGLTNKYTVKIDSNGYVSGFGLAYTANNAAPFSDFIIRADRFSIASPSGPGLTPIVPFIVTTSQSTIDGTVVPAGVYIDGAYIKGGTIQGSAILGGTITNSKLINVSANKITGAALEETSYITSAGFISGSQGWRIKADGTAEFAAASIRGQLIASQINANGLTIRDTSGNIILNASTGDFIGSLNGTAASTVVSNASTALSTANTANGTANTANGTANTANGKADTAIAGLANKLNSNSVNVLAGAGGLSTGNLTWNSVGTRTGGTGVGLTQKGIVGYNTAGATFVLDGTTGDATFYGALSAATGSFAGTLTVGSDPAVSGTSMTGSGAIFSPNGQFAIGNNTTNVTFNGSVLKLNGNVVGIDNMKAGATLPDYVRTYKGGVTTTVEYNDWTYLPMDASALTNTLSVVDAGTYFSYFPAGTYFYELSVPVKNQGSDTNDACYTALLGSADGTSVYELSTCGVNVVGDWQTATITGVGKFTIASSAYVAPVIKTTDTNPELLVVARSGFCTLTWKVYRST